MSLKSTSASELHDRCSGTSCCRNLDRETLKQQHGVIDCEHCCRFLSARRASKSVFQCTFQELSPPDMPRNHDLEIQICVCQCCPICNLHPRELPKALPREVPGSSGKSSVSYYRLAELQPEVDLGNSWKHHSEDTPNYHWGKEIVSKSIQRGLKVAAAAIRYRDSSFL